jgi:hypothetical protein
MNTKIVINEYKNSYYISKPQKMKMIGIWGE